MTATPELVLHRGLEALAAIKATPSRSDPSVKCKTIKERKEIRSLQNKLYYQSKSLEAAKARVDELKSEHTKLRDLNKELKSLEAKAQASAAKANDSAQNLSKKLKDRVDRFSSYREKKEGDLKNVRQRARDKVAAIEDAKTDENAQAVAASEKATAKEFKKMQVCVMHC